MNQPIRLLNPHNGQTLRELYGHDGDTVDLASSGDGTILVSCGFDGTVKVSNLTQPGQDLKSAVSGPFIADVEFLANSRYVALAMGANPGNPAKEFSIKIWDVFDRKLVRQLTGHSNWLTSLSVDHDRNLIVSGSLDGTTRLWNPETGQELHRWEGDGSPIVDVAFTDSDKIVAATRQEVYVYHREYVDELICWPLAESECTHIASVVNGRLVAIAHGGGNIDVFRVGREEPICRIAAGAPISDLCFSSDGQQLAASRVDATINLWRTDQFIHHAGSPECLTIRGPTGAVNGICFSPDGLRLVSCGLDRAVKIWNIRTGQEVLSLPNVGLNGRSNHVAFSPDGKTIVQTDQNQIESWTTRSLPPEDVRWHEQLAEEAKQKRNWYSVAFHNRRLTGLRPEASRYFLQLGHAEAELGNLEEALTAFQRSSLIQSNPLSTYFEVLLLISLNQKTESDRLRMNMLFEYGQSNDPITLNTLAWTFLLEPSTEEITDVIPVAEKAAGSQRFEFLNTLGAVYLRAGKYDSAIETLRQSIAAQDSDDSDPPGNVYDWLLLSLAYSSKSDINQAQVSYDTALRFLSTNDRPSTNSAAESWSQKLEVEALLREAKSALRMSRSAEMIED